MLQAELTNEAKGLFFGNSWDVLTDCCEYAWPKSPEGCWKHLEWVLANERISQKQYDEIKSSIVFVEYTD